MNLRFIRARLIPVASTLALGAFCAASAFAQDSGGAGAVETVTVTGSRLSTGFAAPTPVTAFSAAQLQQVDSTNIANALEQLPQLVGSTLTYNAGSASPSAGTNGQSLLNLRSLGANRTLILLDGTRLAPTNTGGTVDVNNIPQALVSRVDIVTGGASAAYGTDAVAGVVNFILNTRYQGFKADIEGGETQYGDAGTMHGSAVYGGSFFGDRARVVASVDLFTQNGIGDQPNGRRWYDFPVGAYGNPVAGALPTTIQEPNVRSSIGTGGGLITGVQGCATPACNAIVLTEQFGAGGAVVPYNNGTLPSQSSGWTSGGDGEFGENGMSPEQHREQFFAHGEFDLNSNVTGFVEGWFNHSHTDLQGQPAFVVGSKYQITIFPNNAYLPSGLASFFAANPTATSITMGRYIGDAPAVTNNDNMIYQRLSGGFRGNINDVWSFDASLAYNRVQQNLWVDNNTINRNVYAAADAVVNPATGGIVCRSQYYNAAGVFVPGGTGEDPGCVPTDYFGNGSITSTAAHFIEGSSKGDNVFHQTSFEANVRGNLGDDFQLGAGPISVAVGMSWYDQDAHRTVDAVSDLTVSCTGLRGCPTALNGLFGGYQLYNPLPLNGSSSVTEGYTELGIPLLKGSPLAQALDLDIAGRMADYNNSGISYSDKVGVNWSVIDDVRFRLTYSQDVRAPNLTELFSTGQASTGQLSWPASNPTFTGAPSTFGSQDLTAGNPTLHPEHAHTSTLGVVYSPSWLSGFTASVDYYDISISGAITSVSAQQVVNNCYLGQQQYCKLITVAGVPVTTTVGVTSSSPALVVTSESENLAKVYTSGFDLEIGDVTPLWDGNLTSRLLANWKGPNANSSNTPGTKTLGGYGADNYTLTALYDTSGYSVFLEERFISNGKMNPNLIAGQTISYNNVPLIYYTNATLTYKFSSYFDSADEVYLTLTNIFNQPPPVTVTTGGNWIHSTDYSTYDVLGRRFLAGIRIAL